MTPFGFLLLAALVGKDWGVERTRYVDPVTGAGVYELTAPPGDASNLYYHFSNFTADSRYVILALNRNGSAQIFRSEVATGRLVQLTDSPGVLAAGACPDPKNPRRVYYLRGPEAWSLDVEDFTGRKIGEIPRPYTGGFQQPTLSGDGRWLAVTKQRDERTWEIGRIDTQSGEYRTVVTQGFRIGHVQHHPSAPVIFYVWETGGYAPQRSWLVDADGTANRPFYHRTDPKAWWTPIKEWMTHEAWTAGTGEMTMIMDKIGIVGVQLDGASRLIKEGRYWHAAARPDGRFLVADDFEGRIWVIEAATGNTRLVATGVRGERRVHAHPSFDREGRYVIFNSARSHNTVAMVDLSQLPGWDR